MLQHNVFIFIEFKHIFSVYFLPNDTVPSSNNDKEIVLYSIPRRIIF